MPYKDKEQQREYQRTWILNRRKQGIQYLGGRCAHCGSTSNLEIDHIDPNEKSRAMNSLWSYRWETILTELDKCQILCHTCHMEKSRTEGVWAGPIGEGNGSAKLTENDICVIRQLIKSGFTQRTIAVQFEVHHATIGDIARGKTWTHIPGHTSIGETL